MQKKYEKVDLSILDKYSNVPVAVAAKITQKNEVFIRQTMKDGRCPFGIATKTADKSWDFHISPGMLRAYMNGTMCIQFNQLTDPSYMGY